MLIKSIDFPSEVLQAQRDGKLVIFAGAGISMPAPASLPDFAQLANMIGSGASPKPAGETDDRYLGRIHQDGVRVHEMAQRILLDPESKPTELHFLLLKLFGSTHPLRVVTTNFDSHFSTALDGLGLKTVETFFAPALPLGSDFEGLVYLHGAALKAPDRMVLTDGDFGRAYLTYGWAARFLYQLFSTYTVLFVGYSHNDVVMNYLARGLPPQTQGNRFAFSLRGDSNTQWENYGIRVLHYDRIESDNEHTALTEGVKEWVEEIYRGLLARSERIKSIVEAAPPLEGEDADYLKHSLSQLDTARQFTKYARNPGYLEWLETHGFLKALFNARVHLTTVEQELVDWMVREMLAEHSQTVFALVQRNSQILHPEFAWRVHLRLLRRQGEPAVNSIFPTWVALLLSQPHTCLSPDDWSRLLMECRWPEDRECAILLFASLTMPRLLMQRSWEFLSALNSQQPKKLVDFSIDIHARTEHWISESWRTFFSPHLLELLDALEPIVTHHLQAAYALLRLAKSANNRFDPLSFRRQEIISGGLVPNTFDALVNAARDILLFAIKHLPETASIIIERWFKSRVPILMRLAIHGFSSNPAVTAEKKIEWVLKNDLLFRSGYKAEVFALLRENYHIADEVIRRSLVDRILRGRPAEEGQNVSDDTNMYEIFNALVWLTQSDPQCTIASEALASVGAQNPEFRAREHPNLDFWMSPRFEAVSSRFSFDEILAQPPGAFLDRIDSLPAQAPFGERREDYVGAIMTLVVKKPDWGFQLHDELLNRTVTDGEVWRQLFNGWREAHLTEDEWSRWFDAVERLLDFNAQQADGIAEVLYTRGSRKEWAIPETFMDRAYTLSHRVFAVIEGQYISETLENNDWLSLAINRAGGKVAQFWLEYFSALKIRIGDRWTGLEAAEREALERVIASSSCAAALARVIIASQFHYIFYLDPTFALGSLLSLFDWDANELTAKQCWNGFLAWGRWQTAYLNKMLPFYGQALHRIRDFPTAYRESFASHIASIAVFGITDPLADNWLGRFIFRFDTQMRVDFAKTLVDILEQMELEPANQLWDRWFRQYWENRTLGNPLPLEPLEMDHMYLWPLELHSAFPSAVDLLGRSPKPASQHLNFEDELQKLRQFSESYAESVADYLIFILTELKGCGVRAEIETLVAELAKYGVAAHKIALLKDELLRLQ